VINCKGQASGFEIQAWGQAEGLGSDWRTGGVDRRCGGGMRYALPPYACCAATGLANSVFRSLADIMDACEMAWNRFATNGGLIRSLCAVAWVPALPAL
jgi:hypothetical protein